MTEIPTGAPEPRPRPGRPAQLSREQIVQAVISAGDLETLTMRDLAARLSVSHAALYRWVKNRDELFKLVSDVMMERIVPADAPPPAPDGDWRPRLARIAWAMHDEFLAVPGFATHTSRPHPHSAHSFGRLRDAVVAAFADGGVTPDLAEQSWYIFITTVVGWLAVQENPLELGVGTPRFELFLDALLRGLPAREPQEATARAAGR
jgi:AcrR family transcriptional regulator